MKTAAIVLLTTSLFASVAFANDSPYDKAHMGPFASEKLAQSVNLTGLCSNVNVIEWRATKGYKASTSESEKAKTVLNEVCELVAKNFKRFANKQNYVVDTSVQFSQSVSLIPADMNRYGSDVRNLNDATYRFASRSKEYDEDGDVIPIWGYHQRTTAHIYMRNDVLDDNAKEANSVFKTIFAHELFHAMSYQYGMFQQHSGDQAAVDEKMARKFTRFIGLGE